MSLGNGGLSIVGGRKEGWDNPDSTAKNGLGAREINYTMSIKEVVDNVMKKPIFGFDGYNPQPEFKDPTPVQA